MSGTHELDLIKSIFDASDDIIYYEKKWSGEGTLESTPAEVRKTFVLGKEILGERAKECSGVFFMNNINKNNKEIIIAIKDGLFEIAELLKDYNKKRSSWFSRTGSIIKEIGETTNVTTKMFKIFYSSITCDSTPQITSDEIIHDKKAQAFWKANFSE